MPQKPQVTKILRTCFVIVEIISQNLQFTV